MKTREQRQKESREAELSRPQREAEKAALEKSDHEASYRHVTDALSALGIDPENLRDWLAGPRAC